MDKIKVSKEVAEALNLAIKNCGKEHLFNIHSNKSNWADPANLPLNQLSNWKMAQILINGYEVEKTPHENLLELYEDYKVNSDDGIPELVVEKVLEILDIKIKGIND